MDSLPDTWRQLTRLRALELRGNALLEELPEWMPEGLPALELLDVSCCSRLDLSALARFTRLRTLALQGLDLIEPGVLPQALVTQAGQGAPPARIKLLPDLRALAPSLRALSLADNNFAAPPAQLSKLTGLQHLDLSGNTYMKARAGGGGGSVGE